MDRECRTIGALITVVVVVVVVAGWGWLFKRITTTVLVKEWPLARRGGGVRW